MRIRRRSARRRKGFLCAGVVVVVAALTAGFLWSRADSGVDREVVEVPFVGEEILEVARGDDVEAVPIVEGEVIVSHVVESVAAGLGKIKSLPIDGRSVIYLTFDDGPSHLTPEVLDILKSEGVTATFFVINQSDAYNHVIKRAYDEGHTIAIHSYTHNYGKIYASEAAFFEDLYAIQNKVESIIGEKTYYARFPGGASNTVSRFNPGIMTRLVSAVKEKGFTYFDWNVSSGDAGGARSSDDVYRNVVGGLRHERENIVLLHDYAGNTKSVQALRRIIQYGKENGYIFAGISRATTAYLHGVNN